MNCTKGKEVFTELLKNIDRNEAGEFLRWVLKTSEQALNELTETSTEKAILNQIRSDLRETLPIEAVLSTENIVYPSAGENADCTSMTTIHVDGFLYDEEAVDELVDAGRLSRNYCTKCGSHQVAALTFISHSMSCTQLQYVFTYLLPDLQGKLILDVGSRLGPVLYGAYLYTRASKIIGVEINGDFCQLQQKVIEKYHMVDRIQVIHDDICNQVELLHNADVVVMNNVFEFFVDVDTQKRIWSIIQRSVRKRGAFVVATPSLEESLESLQLLNLLDGWVQPVNRPDVLRAAEAALFNEPADSDINEIYLYSIL